MTENQGFDGVYSSKLDADEHSVDSDRLNGRGLGKPGTIPVSATLPEGKQPGILARFFARPRPASEQRSDPLGREPQVDRNQSDQGSV